MADGPKVPIPNKPGKSNWVEKAGGLPSFIRRIAEHLQGEGMDTSRAIATAVSQCKKVCATGKTFGGRTEVSAAARARYCNAAREWEAMKGRSSVKESLGERTLSFGQQMALGVGAAQELAELQERLGREASALLEGEGAASERVADLAAIIEAADLPRHRGLPRLLEAKQAANSFGGKHTVVTKGGRSLKVGPVAFARMSAGGFVDKSKTSKAAQNALGASASQFDESKHKRGGKGSPEGGRFVKGGSSGAAVKGVQQRVGAKTDGKFGNMTAAAVKTFQKKHGLQVDGVVGAQTAAALLGKKDAAKVAVGKLTAQTEKKLEALYSKAGPSTSTSKKKPSERIATDGLRALADDPGPGDQRARELSRGRRRQARNKAHKSAAQKRPKMMEDEDPEGGWQGWLEEARRRMASFTFDPDQHPRDAYGKFAKTLHGLEIGKSVKLPDGTRVRKDSATRATVIRSAWSNTNLPLEVAAQDALDRSAQGTLPNAIGGDTQHPTLDAARGQKERIAGSDAHVASQLEEARGLLAGLDRSVRDDRRSVPALERRIARLEREQRKRREEGGAATPEGQAATDQMRQPERVDLSAAAQQSTPGQVADRRAADAARRDAVESGKVPVGWTINLSGDRGGRRGIVVAQHEDGSHDVIVGRPRQLVRNVQRRDWTGPEPGTTNELGELASWERANPVPVPEATVNAAQERLRTDLVARPTPDLEQLRVQSERSRDIFAASLDEPGFRQAHETMDFTIGVINAELLRRREADGGNAPETPEAPGRPRVSQADRNAQVLAAFDLITRDGGGASTSEIARELGVSNAVARNRATAAGAQATDVNADSGIGRQRNAGGQAQSQVWQWSGEGENGQVVTADDGPEAVRGARVALASELGVQDAPSTPDAPAVPGETDSQRRTRETIRDALVSSDVSRSSVALMGRDVYRAANSPGPGEQSTWNVTDRNGNPHYGVSPDEVGRIMSGQDPSPRAVPDGPLPGTPEGVRAGLDDPATRALRRRQDVTDAENAAQNAAGEAMGMLDVGDSRSIGGAVVRRRPDGPFGRMRFTIDGGEDVSLAQGEAQLTDRMNARVAAAGISEPLLPTPTLSPDAAGRMGSASTEVQPRPARTAYSVANRADVPDGIGTDNYPWVVRQRARATGTTRSVGAFATQDDAEAFANRLHALQDVVTGPGSQRVTGRQLAGRGGNQTVYRNVASARSVGLVGQNGVELQPGDVIVSPVRGGGRGGDAEVAGDNLGARRVISVETRADGTTRVRLNNPGSAGRMANSQRRADSTATLNLTSPQILGGQVFRGPEARRAQEATSALDFYSAQPAPTQARPGVGQPAIITPGARPLDQRSINAPLLPDEDLHFFAGAQPTQAHLTNMLAARERGSLRASEANMTLVQSGVLLRSADGSGSYKLGTAGDRLADALGLPQATPQAGARANAVAAGMGAMHVNVDRQETVGDFTYFREGGGGSNRVWSVRNSKLDASPTSLAAEDVQAHIGGSDRYTSPTMVNALRSASGDGAISVGGSTPIAPGVERHPDPPAGFRSAPANVQAADAPERTDRPADVAAAASPAEALSFGGRALPPVPQATSRGNGVKVNAIVQALHGFEKGGLRAEVQHAAGSGFSGIIRDSNGNSVGTFQREMRSDGKSVYHAYFAMSDGVRDAGFGSAFIRAQFDAYKAQGLTHVDVSPGLSVGGYQWAKMGFELNGTSLKQHFSNNLRHRLDRVSEDRVPKALKDELIRQIEAGELTKISRLALWGSNTTWTEMREGKEIKMHLGKVIMLGTNWSGRYDLSKHVAR